MKPNLAQWPNWSARPIVPPTLPLSLLPVNHAGPHLMALADLAPSESFEFRDSLEEENCIYRRYWSVGKKCFIYDESNDPKDLENFPNLIKAGTCFEISVDENTIDEEDGPIVYTAGPFLKIECTDRRMSVKEAIKDTRYSFAFVGMVDTGL